MLLSLLKQCESGSVVAFVLTHTATGAVRTIWRCITHCLYWICNGTSQWNEWKCLLCIEEVPVSNPDFIPVTPTSLYLFFFQSLQAKVKIAHRIGHDHFPPNSQIWRRGSSFCIVTSLEAEVRGIVIRFQTKAKYFSLLQRQALRLTTTPI